MHQPLKIIHITSDYPPRPLWGMGVYVEKLQQGFSEKHKDVYSCVATASKSEGESGVCITTTKEDDLLFLSKDEFSIFDNYENFLLWQDMLADKILDYFKINSTENTVLHVNNWMSWLTAKKVLNFIDLPIVSSVHFLQKQYEFMIENPIPNHHHEIMKIEHEMLSKSDEVICFSMESKNMVREVYGIDRMDINVIPHTSKVNGDDSGEIKSTHNILFLGRLTKDKGILEVIKVVENIKEKYSDVHLHIIGDGDLHNEISELKLPFVTLYGYIDDAQKIKMISKECSFSILLSTSDVFPISIIDSMACACIPFLPDRGTVATMFEDGVSGFRIKGNLERVTADTIIDLLNDDNKIINMRKSVKKYYNLYYSADGWLKSIRGIFEKALLDK